MTNTSVKKEKRARRHNRIRARVTGTKECPRLCVFRSNRYLYAQIVNDENATTLCSVDTRKMKGKNLRERATEAGTEIATTATKKDIKKVVFDRGGFLYTGSIKDFAEGARKGGLKF